MYEDLVEAGESHETVVAQSRAFWSMTIQSHLNSAILRLCRIYDQQKSSMNLARWLKLIKQNQKWFKRHPLDVPQLDKDIKFSSKENPLVNNLTRFRGNVVAHMGENYVLNIHNSRKSFKLTYGDLKELMGKSMTIVNHYSNPYNGHTWSTNLVSADDFEFIFRELSAAVERLRAQP